MVKKKRKVKVPFGVLSKVGNFVVVKDFFLKGPRVGKTFVAVKRFGRIVPNGLFTPSNASNRRRAKELAMQLDKFEKGAVAGAKKTVEFSRRIGVGVGNLALDFFLDRKPKKKKAKKK